MKKQTEKNKLTALYERLSHDAEKIPIPSEHWKRTGEPVRAAKYADPYAWSATTIGYILKRPEYTGHKVLGKTVCENYKTKSSRKTAPEEQYIFEGAIPAIVGVETWQTVQKIRGTVCRAPKRQNTPNRLTGLLYCADYLHYGTMPTTTEPLSLFL